MSALAHLCATSDTKSATTCSPLRWGAVVEILRLRGRATPLRMTEVGGGLRASAARPYLKGAGVS